MRSTTAAGRMPFSAIFRSALKDCNEALQIRPRFADALDSRGLVNLKLGRARLRRFPIMTLCCKSTPNRRRRFMAAAWQGCAPARKLAATAISRLRR